MAQFRQFLVVVLPTLAAGFSLNVKPKERSQQRSAAEAAAVGCDDCGFSSLGLPSDAEKVSRTIDAISGRRLHTNWKDVDFANCNNPSECCPNGGGVSNDGGSWSGESSGPDQYANKRVKCDAGCDTGCDEGGYSCNGSCEPHLALPLQTPASSPPPLEPIRAPVQATAATGTV
jgi:hypothetical protein